MSNNDYERQQFWGEEITHKTSKEHVFSDYEAVGI